MTAATAGVDDEMPGDVVDIDDRPEGLRPQGRNAGGSRAPPAKRQTRRTRDQHARIGVARMRQHLTRRPFLNNLPLRQHDDPVGALSRDREIVGDDETAIPSDLVTSGYRRDPLLHGDVERRGRFGDK